ncbi:Hpt domain-containing protein [Sulfurimonas sp. HSL1-2]|uniref:Hpt domain-containing protein n=1 Tax=Thiomicrolovo zhangzhouensis TaxID=3131933 RepID=UPI0031F7D9D4
MLIYNHNKKLVGIDDETLHHLGYKTLSEFLAEHNDVAEMFVKKPGYIHNFQNFPWIDFVLHADAEDTRAIIQNDKVQFSCSLSLSPIFMTDAPDNEGYVVQLKQIKTLSGTIEPFERPASTAPSALPDIPFETPKAETPAAPGAPAEEEFEFKELPAIDLPDLNLDGSLSGLEDIEPESFGPDIEPEPFTFEEDFELPESFEPETAPAKTERPMLGDYINQEEQAYLDNLQTDSDYLFDPHVAADELGLPVELIEEFIGDFIQQAHEFKAGLFNANHEEDFDEVHLLSHKLKGVAANLRIEDAFEVLSIVNTSRDQVEIEANLKQFYLIIAKMEGKPLPEMMAATPPESEPVEPEAAAPALSLPAEEEEDDLYDFGDLLGTSAPEELPAAKEEPAAPTVEEEPASLELGSLMDDEIELPPIKDENAPAIEEEPREPVEDVEPFTLDVIPETEQHLIDDAEEHEHYKQVSGDSAKDTALMSGSEESELHYDLPRAAAEIGLSESFVKSLVEDFIDDAKKKKGEILQAIDDGDLKKVRAAAFEFKGLSDNLRIEDVSRSLTKLLRHEQLPALKREAEHFYSLLNQL